MVGCFAVNDILKDQKSNEYDHCTDNEDGEITSELVNVLIQGIQLCRQFGQIHGFFKIHNSVPCKLGQRFAEYSNDEKRDRKNDAYDHRNSRKDFVAFDKHSYLAYIRSHDPVF